MPHRSLFAARRFPTIPACVFLLAASSLIAPTLHAQTTREPASSADENPTPDDERAHEREPHTRATPGKDATPPASANDAAPDDDATRAAEDSAAPVQLPHVFFDNRMNPIDYLGREIDFEGEEATDLGSLNHGAIILREDFDAPRDVRRRYVLVTHRNTKISHRNRVHELDDELRQTLDVTLRAPEENQSPDVMRILVRHMEPRHVPGAESLDAPLSVPIPDDGLALVCRQREFQVTCHDERNNAMVSWPQWATLDMSDWFSRRALTPDSRWRRTLPTPETIGWRDGVGGRAQSALHVSESGPASGENTTHVQGSLDGKGELRVHHRTETMQMEGQIDLEFDHADALVRRLIWQWDGAALSDGFLNGHRYKWERQTSAILRVTSSPTP